VAAALNILHQPLSFVLLPFIDFYSRSFISEVESCIYLVFLSKLTLLPILFRYLATMRSSIIISALAAFVSSVTAADGVKGAAEGFAKGM
jgi:hypothetical protein